RRQFRRQRGEGGVARLRERGMQRHIASSKSALGMVRVPMVILPGQGSTVSGPTPFCSAAVAVAILNVEPGGYIPFNAAGLSPAAEFCATARISPVDGWIATRIAPFGALSTAACAAAWTGRLSVVVNGLAGPPAGPSST